MADAHAEKHHDYHLVDPSPWPVVGAVSVFLTAVGLIIWMRSMGGGEGLFGLRGPAPFAVGFAGILFTMLMWWRDVIREANTKDAKANPFYHTPVVQLHLRYGMILFIASEVMFFVAWFWAYFDASLFPAGIHPLEVTTPDGATEVTKEIIGMVKRNELTGGHWPPQPNEAFHGTFNPWGLPLVNTLVLLLSGTTVTWAHHALLHNDRRGLKWGLVLTIALGILFTSCQAYEYVHAGFHYAGHIYGATFFMATGFHGAHVIIGTLFLTVCLFRAMAGHFSPKQHFGFEAAAWYWHFVDVVWLFLFTVIYVIGAGTPLAH
jgi:cytochrome c oxidase subunit III